MIDFSGLVIEAAMDAFGQPVTIMPVVSQPGAPPFPARGVYASKPVEIQNSETGLFHRSFRSQLGIKLADFAVAIVQGDQIAMPQGTFEVADVVIDGQGGADLPLQKLA